MGVEEDTAAVEDKKEYGHARGLHLQLSNETERAALLADDYKKQNEPKKKKKKKRVCGDWRNREKSLQK
jgi:hypothetical protein